MNKLSILEATESLNNGESLLEIIYLKWETCMHETDQGKRFSLMDVDFLDRIGIVKNTYYRKFGLKAILIDKDANIINEENEEWYCKNYYCLNKEDCQKEHLLVLKESVQWGGNFFFCCYKRFILWSIPIFFEGEFYGGIISGFTLFEKDRNENKEKEYSNFFKQKEKIKYLNPSNLNYIINFLSLLMAKNKVSDIHYLLTLQKKYYVQKEIVDKVTDKGNKTKLYEELFSDKLNKFLSSIKISDLEEIKTNLIDVLSEIYQEFANDLEMLKFRMLELFVLISRVMIELGDKPGRFYELTVEYIKKSEEISDIYFFSLWITDLIEDFTKRMLENRKKIDYLKLENAIEYAIRNIDKNITVAEVASSIGFSESKFSHLFTEKYCVSFSKYLMKLRIDEAKKLLRTTSNSITEIAINLGFYDQSHFSKIFKKFTGYTPNEFREKP